MAGFQHPPTRRGYSPYEVVSALQKSVRRSQVDEAVYWVVELDKSGHTTWAWNRLDVMVSEDIGIAAPPGLVADFRALYSAHKNAKPKPPNGGLRIIHATVMLALAPKSRLIDWLCLNHHSDFAERLEIPSEALDLHTRKGKQMGRGMDHFLSEGDLLIEPEPLGNFEAEQKELFRRVHAKDTRLPVNPWLPNVGQPAQNPQHGGSGQVPPPQQPRAFGQLRLDNEDRR